MFRKMLFLSFILLFQGLLRGCDSRTNDDVINDFEPVFAELHANFSLMYTYATQNGDRILNEMGQLISDENNIDRESLVETQEAIKKNVSITLHESGMDQHPDLVKSCLEAKSLAVSDLVQQSYGGLRVCVQLAQKVVSASYNDSQSLYQKINNEHIILEVTKSECRKMPTPFDVQTCLIRDLYLFYPSYIIEARSAVELTVKSWQRNSNDLKDSVATCGYFIRRNMVDDSSTLLNNFRKCVYAVKP